jgi:hypothetical protein
LTVNIELTKIKVYVGINLKWPNVYYPCYLVGGPRVTFLVTTKRNITRGEFVFPTLRFGRLYDCRIQSLAFMTNMVPVHELRMTTYSDVVSVDFKFQFHVTGRVSWPVISTIYEVQGRP